MRRRTRHKPTHQTYPSSLTDGKAHLPLCDSQADGVTWLPSGEDSVEHYAARLRRDVNDFGPSPSRAECCRCGRRTRSPRTSKIFATTRRAEAKQEPKHQPNPDPSENPRQGQGQEYSWHPKPHELDAEGELAQRFCRGFWRPLDTTQFAKPAGLVAKKALHLGW